MAAETHGGPGLTKQEAVLILLGMAGSGLPTPATHASEPLQDLPKVFRGVWVALSPLSTALHFSMMNTFSV